LLLPLGAGTILLLGAAAPTLPFELPPEDAPNLPAGPGADLTAGVCSACHSIDYVTSQPRGEGAQFWKDSVLKMLKTYGAPVSAEDAETIATYLAQTYGGPDSKKHSK
jgi:mono/diheme cytochrome c family protein